MREAVDLAVAVRADVDDGGAGRSALTERCEADTRAARIRDERRASALRRRLLSEETEAEAAVHQPGVAVLRLFLNPMPGRPRFPPPGGA
ncbi:hypothetical protein AQI70_34280 [Streptomyces curacoi]|uniref:Uncharacterized protein n=1 Tax=Streptomyces curacoi TaxID=146536 RepID=A0A124GUX7_9ACTN|nr:hypothetical protein AQI70_34280 [Streptomyces curacoi]